ncbi:methyltransferase type 11 [Bordetella genomosp. 1]|uniref:Methyltransferase type 11 n=1 Tax=Bordetella genomosp. 1 TaxID=1395607 RepID=A0A261SCW1_9BORD|nr:methyltransferase domain-containing protein [Bordetella genomosp. 1]OZI35234.1 methyltransferase type 11 [Bordetella genomosp. 1]OZI63777.1 methyltransferase type 11 [Bordetella genomosp. 1]
MPTRRYHDDAQRHPIKPYHATVLSILQAERAQRVLDAPCGQGWLGHALRRRGEPVQVEGLSLWEFPLEGDGYASAREHDLETPLPAHCAEFDAVVCAEALHLVRNPGLLLEGFARAVRPGGRIIITTPNTWYLGSRLQFLLRGYHAGFRPSVGRQRGEYIPFFPLSYPQLHLFFESVGLEDIRLHEVDEPKPRRWTERMLAWPARMYLSGRQRRAQDATEQNYWADAARDQALHGRWLVMSARRRQAQ